MKTVRPQPKCITTTARLFSIQSPGALSKELLIRQEDVQVLHGFDSVEHAQAYLSSELFQNDVFVSLKPLWSAEPEVRIYSAA